MTVMSRTIDDATWTTARIIHEARIAFCWGKSCVGVRDPWPEDDKRPGDFGYERIPWVDIAVAQAKALAQKERLL
jgi:hypothetical protein